MDLDKTVGQAAPILITGGSGQIGGAVMRLCAEAGIAAVAPPSSELNLGDEIQIKQYIASQPFSAVVNCAAFTAVDQAEVEKDFAWQINANAPRIIARFCAETSIPLVHISTDYVFNGRKDGYYVESDPIDPLGEYGKSKAAGERAVAESGCDYAILRTAWVLSDGPKNFLSTMLRIGAERDEIRVVKDQFGCPTHASDVAEVILKVLHSRKQSSGIWHCVNEGEASWHELAAHIFEFNRKHGLKEPVLIGISSEEYPTLAPRPMNSRLSTQQLYDDFGIKLRPWRDAVTAILDQKLADHSDR